MADSHGRGASQSFGIVGDQDAAQQGTWPSQRPLGDANTTSRPKKQGLPKFIDFPFLIAAILTTGFYVLMSRPFMAESPLHRYTTEHLLEYVVVSFFIWSLVDAVWRGLAFPRELIALRQEWLRPRVLKDHVQQVGEMLQVVQSKSPWLQESRLGKRFARALEYLAEKGSADGFDDHLQYLAAQDEERTYANYALLRFICWVTPVLGILGTVIHFGSAFGGLSVDELGNNLGKVVGEIGTAFNTTTIALAAAIVSMFTLFLCERTERGIIHAIDRRVDLELLNRFEVHDENLTPFLSAVQASSQAGLSAMDQAVQRQMQIWSNALLQLQQQSEERLQTHAQLWEQSLVKVHHHFESSDVEREKRLTRVLGELQVQRNEQKAAAQGMLNQMAALHAQFSQMVEAMTSVNRDGGQLVKLQHSLSENLRVLEQTQHFDQAMHGLTAAIHLLTARHDPAAKARAAA